MSTETGQVQKERVESSRERVYASLDPIQQQFVDFVLAQYINLGVDGLRQDRLPQWLSIKYYSQMEGIEALAGTVKARDTFVGF